MLALTSKRLDDAARHFEDALTTNTRMNARPWLAHTATDYARMLHARNARRDHERAQELLDRALQIYRDLGMATYAAAARELAQAARTTT